MALLKFTFENAKLKGIWHYSLPSGHTCPGANSCLIFADRVTGKITDKQTAVDGQKFRCYAAMDEARRPNVRKPRWANFDVLKGKTISQIVKMIVESLKETGLNRGCTLRVHIGGDYFFQVYFNDWIRRERFFLKVIENTKSTFFESKSFKSTKPARQPKDIKPQK